MSDTARNKFLRDLEKRQPAPAQPSAGPFDCEEFYNLMQTYRHWPITKPAEVVKAYTDVQDYCAHKLAAAVEAERRACRDAVQAYQKREGRLCSCDLEIVERMSTADPPREACAHCGVYLRTLHPQANLYVHQTGACKVEAERRRHRPSFEMRKPIDVSGAVTSPDEPPASSARDGLNAKCRTHGNEHPDALCPQREAVSEAGLSKEREAEIRRRLEESRDGVESSAWFDAHVREDVDYLLAKLDRLRTALRAVEAERHFVLDEDKKRAIVADAAIKAADSAIERIATLERQLAAVRELADRWEHEGGDFAPVHLRQKCAAELRAAIAPPPSGKP